MVLGVNVNKSNIIQALMFSMPLSKYHFDVEDELVNYSNLVWDDSFYPKPSEEKLIELFNTSVMTYENDEDYRIKRKECYPTAEEQLAIIFDIGIDGWKEYIINVKNKYPKPEVQL
jgi:hypothetical protein